MRDLRAFFFPDPPRRVPAHRALSIAFRTAHLAAFGALLGGHVFDVEPARLLPFLVAAIVTGVALMALELASTFEWFLMGKGLAVLLKLVLLAVIPIFWNHRVPILLMVVAVASISSHMPSRFRHYRVRRGETVCTSPAFSADATAGGWSERRAGDQS